MSAALEPAAQFPAASAGMEDDRPASSAAVMLGAALISVAWVAWASVASVPVYVGAASARIELVAHTYPIAAPYSGLVVHSNLRVGQTVGRDQVLVELDSRAERLRVHELHEQDAGIGPQLMRLRAQVDAERDARSKERRSAEMAAQEAQARVAEIEATLSGATTEVVRLRALFADGMVAARGLEAALTDVRRLNASRDAASLAARRIADEQATRERERDVRLHRLEGEVARLEAARKGYRAEANRRTHEAERRSIRAPTGGRITEAIVLLEGAVLQEGDRIGSVATADPRLRVAAQFVAARALGRVQAGQQAIVQLEGYSWTEYGALQATVAQVAEEARDGLVRVELTINGSQQNFRGALQHGMPARVEVLLESATPIELLARTAGRWWTAPP